MFLCASVILAVLIALARGGKWQSLKTSRFKRSWLVFIAIGLQLMIFNPLWDKHFRDLNINNYLYVLSIFILVIFLLVNINIWGFRVLGLGIISNSLAIITNGGYMPSSFEALKKVLPAEKVNLLINGSASYNVVLISDQTRFKFLCDIFYVPYINVYSIGDILIAVGAFLTIQQIMLHSDGVKIKKAIL